jgi:seryl-tRNA synthetase
MLDLNTIREHTDEIRKGLADLNATAPIDEILSLDLRRRELLTETEALRARRNSVSKDISRMKDPAGRQTLIEEMRGVGDRITVLDEELKTVDQNLQGALLEVPNMPHPSVPVGPDETHNVITRVEGEIPHFDFNPLPHWDLGPMLGIIDFERGVKISGSRFYVLKGLGARLQRAIIAWMLDLHIRKHGYTEIYPPYMVSEKCMVGTGQLPKFADTVYRDIEDDLWLISTAEIPLTNMHRGRSSMRAPCR